MHTAAHKTWALLKWKLPSKTSSSTLSAPTVLHYVWFDMHSICAFFICNNMKVRWTTIKSAIIARFDSVHAPQIPSPTRCPNWLEYNWSTVYSMKSPKIILISTLNSWMSFRWVMAHPEWTSEMKHCAVASDSDFEKCRSTERLGGSLLSPFLVCFKAREPAGEGIFIPPTQFVTYAPTQKSYLVSITTLIGFGMRNAAWTATLGL